jgi:hypothetical protein
MAKITIEFSTGKKIKFTMGKFLELFDPSKSAFPTYPTFPVYPTYTTDKLSVHEDLCTFDPIVYYWVKNSYTFVAE